MATNFTINKVAPGEGNRQRVGGLRCDLGNKDFEGVIVLEPRSWPTSECGFQIELESTQAHGFCTELGKALLNTEFKGMINDYVKQFGLEDVVKIEVIGVRSDGLVLVSNKLPKQFGQLTQALLKSK